jgi:hypothetical protein
MADLAAIANAERDGICVFAKGWNGVRCNLPLISEYAQRMAWAETNGEKEGAVHIGAREALIHLCSACNPCAQTIDVYDENKKPVTLNRREHYEAEFDKAKTEEIVRA